MIIWIKTIMEHVKGILRKNAQELALIDMTRFVERKESPIKMTVRCAKKEMSLSPKENAI